MISAKWTKQVIESGKEADAVNAQVYGELMDLVAGGAIKPVIDRVLPFEQIVEAHRLVDSGRKRGSVVVTVP